MIKKRIGKDYTVVWSGILSNGEPASLEGRNIILQLSTPRSVVLDVQNIEVRDNTIRFRWGVDMQPYLGVYHITLWENKGQDHQTVLDMCTPIQLVSSTCQESDNEGLEVTPDIELSGGDLEMAVKGDKGDSAYQIAVNNGFVGSEQEWLASLKGEKGDKLLYSDLTDEDIRELQKPAADATASANAAASNADNKAQLALSAANDANNAAEKANKAAEQATEAAAGISVYVTDVKDTKDITID